MHHTLIAGASQNFVKQTLYKVTIWLTADSGKASRPAAASHWWGTEQTSAADRAPAETETLTQVHAGAPAQPTHQHTALATYWYLRKPPLLGFYLTIVFMEMITLDRAASPTQNLPGQWKHSFYRLDAFPITRTTLSKQWRELKDRCQRGRINNWTVSVLDSTNDSWGSLCQFSNASDTQVNYYSADNITTHFTTSSLYYHIYDNFSVLLI